MLPRTIHFSSRWMHMNGRCSSQRTVNGTPSRLPKSKLTLISPRIDTRKRSKRMSSVRVLAGTRKGAFILTSDGKREKWDVSGPHFGGWEIYHLKGSPADPNRIYASQTSGWFGQIIPRSNDGGKTWEPAGNASLHDGIAGTHQWYDGTPHPGEFKRVWHLERTLTDPETVYA